MAMAVSEASPILNLLPDRRGGAHAGGGRRHLPRVRPRVHAREGRGRRAGARALGRARRARLPGREPPRGVRRRRARAAGAVDRRRGDLGGRLLAAPDRRLARDRRQHPRQARDAGAEGPLAARHRRRHDQDRVRDHRGGRRVELAQALDLAQARRRQVLPQRPEDVHLGRRGGARGARRRAHASTTTGASGCRRSASSTSTRPASRAR